MSPVRNCALFTSAILIRKSIAIDKKITNLSLSSLIAPVETINLLLMSTIYGSVSVIIFGIKNDNPEGIPIHSRDTGKGRNLECRRVFLELRFGTIRHGFFARTSLLYLSNSEN